MAKQISVIKLSCCVKFWNDKLFFWAWLFYLCTSLILFFLYLCSHQIKLGKWKSEFGEYEKSGRMKKRKRKRRTQETRERRREWKKNQQKWKIFCFIEITSDKIDTLCEIYTIKKNMKWIKSTHRGNDMRWIYTWSLIMLQLY